ncbi:MAG: DUF2691 family protein [Clostridia bacterium]|nr:DUF2691 family protein [Clostridia bacterium]
MRIGISFQIPNEHGYLLSKLLSCVDTESYFWDVRSDEIYSNNLEYPISGTYTGKELLQILPKEKAYVLFAIMHAYVGEPCPLHTLEDFLQGTCEISIFIVDVTEIEVYCTQPSMLSVLSENIKEVFKVEVGEITKETCQRACWDCP